MLNKTTLSALRVLIYLGRQGKQIPIPIVKIAKALHLSRANQAKIVSVLVKAHLLVSHRGAHGGVAISRPLSTISLLEIIEVCQGRFLADYCAEASDIQPTCAFHQAMKETHDGIIRVLSRWTLAELVARPGPAGMHRKNKNCRVAVPL